MNSVKLTRSAQITGVSGILLLIGLLAFPWYSLSAFGFTATATAVQANGSWAAILGLIVLIALLGTIAVRSFTSTKLPDLPISWSAAELYAAIAVAVFIVIKFLSHIGNFGWGFYVDLLLTIGLVYGAAQLTRDAPANSATSESGAEPTT
jgi:hypothetical protein